MNHSSDCSMQKRSCVQCKFLARPYGLTRWNSFRILLVDWRLSNDELDKKCRHDTTKKSQFHFNSGYYWHWVPVLPEFIQLDTRKKRELEVSRSRSLALDYFGRQIKPFVDLPMLLRGFKKRNQCFLGGLLRRIKLYFYDRRFPIDSLASRNSSYHGIRLPV